MKFKNYDHLIGTKVNNRTILDWCRKRETLYILYQCECGEVSDCTKQNFYKNTKCKYCRGYTEYLSGQRFNHYVTLERHYVNNSSRRYWKCRCDCGRIKIISEGDLKHSCKQCKNCSARKYVGKLSSHLYGRYKRQAKICNRDFNVSQKFLSDLYEKQDGKCKLSGINIVFGDTTRDQDSGKTTASLDRIDSTKGYIEDNVQWIHKRINKIKTNMPQEEFIYFCKLIAEYNK